MQDIRWQQRFNNLKRAFEQLGKAVKMEEVSELEREGLIQRFEYTFELAWLVMKDFLEDQGYQNITGSKDAIKQAYQAGLITDAENWLEMVESRKLSTHTYNEETALQIADKIRKDYFSMIETLVKNLEVELNKQKN